MLLARVKMLSTTSWRQTADGCWSRLLPKSSDVFANELFIGKNYIYRRYISGDSNFRWNSGRKKLEVTNYDPLAKLHVSLSDKGCPKCHVGRKGRAFVGQLMF